jgi:hypothetical protein
LLEASVWHPQEAVHAFDHLAQRTWIKPYENRAGIGNRRRREIQLVPDHRVQTPIENHALFAAVRDHFDLANDDIGSSGRSVHLSAQRQLELADTVCRNRELRSANALRIDCEALVCRVFDEREPGVGLKLQADIATRTGVVVHGHRNGNLVALRQRHRQIQIDEEIPENLQTGSRAAHAGYSGLSRAQRAAHGFPVAGGAIERCPAIRVGQVAWASPDSAGRIAFEDMGRADWWGDLRHCSWRRTLAAHTVRPVASGRNGAGDHHDGLPWRTGDVSHQARSWGEGLGSAHRGTRRNARPVGLSGVLGSNILPSDTLLLRHLRPVVRAECLGVHGILLPSIPIERVKRRASPRRTRGERDNIANDPREQPRESAVGAEPGWERHRVHPNLRQLAI